MHRSRAGSVILLLLLFVGTLGACKSKEAGARESFSKQHTCPEDRVEVRSRPDVTPSMTVTPSEPPADIKSDPARLKMWQDEQDRRTKSSDTSCEMFEARGCGHQTLLCCMRPPKHMDRVNCFTYPYGNVSKW